MGRLEAASLRAVHSRTRQLVAETVAQLCDNFWRAKTLGIGLNWLYKLVTQTLMSLPYSVCHALLVIWKMDVTNGFAGTCSVSVPTFVARTRLTSMGWMRECGRKMAVSERFERFISLRRNRAITCIPSLDSTRLDQSRKVYGDYVDYLITHLCTFLIQMRTINWCNW